MRALSLIPYLVTVGDCYVSSMNKPAGMDIYVCIVVAPGLSWLSPSPSPQGPRTELYSCGENRVSEMESNNNVVGP